MADNIFKALVLGLLLWFITTQGHKQQEGIGRFVPQGSGVIDTVTGEWYVPEDKGGDPSGKMSWRKISYSIVPQFKGKTASGVNYEVHQ